jgi:hypothetical protein
VSDHRLGASNIFLRGSKTETVEGPMEDEEETPADEEEVEEDKEGVGEGAVEEDEEEELEARQMEDLLGPSMRYVRLLAAICCTVPGSIVGYTMFTAACYFAPGFNNHGKDVSEEESGEDMFEEEDSDADLLTLNGDIDFQSPAATPRAPRQGAAPSATPRATGCAARSSAPTPASSGPPRRE